MNEAVNPKNEKIKRIGIMGGTFDPIHYGHLVAAEAVRSQFEMDKIIFIPSGIPPHKRGRHITEAHHRYLMTFLAASTNDYFEVSRIEIDREGFTYTIDTIKTLRSLWGPETVFYFITGADAMLDIMTWYQIDELMGICDFIAVTRPGFNKKDLEKKLLEIKSLYNKDILSIEIPALAISSTDIRSRVQKGESIKYLLPESVEGYIKKSGIYRK